MQLPKHMLNAARELEYQDILPRLMLHKLELESKFWGVEFIIPPLNSPLQLAIVAEATNKNGNKTFCQLFSKQVIESFEFNTTNY